MVATSNDTAEVESERESMNQETRYKLPEEQQTEEAKEAGEEENLPAVMQEAIEMEDEMLDIASRTNPDGTVTGYVEEIHYTKKNGTIAVDVDLPAEPDTVRFHYEKPKNWTREWEWVRFVEEYAGGPAHVANLINPGEDVSLEALVGEDTRQNTNGESISVKVKRKEDNYQIVIPKSYQDYFYKISRHRYGLSRQNHIIWRLIPMGIGAWAGLSFSLLNFEFLGLLGTILNFLVLGSAGAGIAGFLLLILGSLFLGWGK